MEVFFLDRTLQYAASRSACRLNNHSQKILENHFEFRNPAARLQTWQLVLHHTELGSNNAFNARDIHQLHLRNRKDIKPYKNAKSLLPKKTKEAATAGQKQQEFHPN